MVAQRSVTRKEREAERRQQLAQELSELAVLDEDWDGLFIAVPSVSVPDGAPHRVSVHLSGKKWIVGGCDELHCDGYKYRRCCMHVEAANLLVARINRMSERVSTTSQEYAHAEREERQARYERWARYEAQIGAR